MKPHLLNASLKHSINFHKLQTRMSLELDFGLHQCFSFHNPMHFSHFLLTLKHIKPFAHTLILYRGDGNFTNAILENAHLHTAYEQWRTTQPETTSASFCYHFYSIIRLSEYLHTLTQEASLTCPLSIHFEKVHLTPEEKTKIFQKKYFPHIDFILEDDLTISP